MSSTSAPSAAAAPAQRTAKTPRHAGSSYTPGMYDALLPIRDHARPEELRAVTVECAGSNAVLIEHLHSGVDRRHFFRPTAEENSWSAFIKLPTGREVWLEVRYAADAPDEDAEPWGRGGGEGRVRGGRAFRRAF